MVTPRSPPHWGYGGPIGVGSISGRPSFPAAHINIKKKRKGNGKRNQAVEGKYLTDSGVKVGARVDISFLAFPCIPLLFVVFNKLPLHLAYTFVYL